MHALWQQTTRRLALAALLPAIAAGLAGCATGRGSDPAGPRPEDRAAAAPLPGPTGTGAIYQPVSAALLLGDVKARRVGDVLTVRLNERTQASKSNSTGAAKTSTIDTGNPTLLGGVVTRGGDPLLSNSIETSQEFNGRGNSSQSNQLDGSLTVTVTEVMPNGNLRVAGEKWLTLNTGEEFIRVEGIVRTTDIDTNNSVSSLEIADARITYSGKGPLQDANRPGLLTRLFLKFWPL
jgi:flagellar L-ring protein FlgH